MNAEIITRRRIKLFQLSVPVYCEESVQYVKTKHWDGILKIRTQIEKEN